MADTYTDELRIRLQEDGANSTTWGSLTNTNLQLIEDAVSGMVEIATTGGTTTLTTVSGGTDQARMAILKVTGTLVSNATIEVPAKTKKYMVWNATSGAYTVTVKTNAGTGILVTQSLVQELFCDATNVYPSGVATPLDSITSGVTGTGSMVRATSPTLVTPVLGAATGTSLALGGGTALTTTNRTGTGNLVLATAPTLTGLTVSGGNFVSRGISDTATAVALSLSGSGANSVTIANSATNPTIGTSAGDLSLGTSGGVSIVAANTASASNYLYVQPGIISNENVVLRPAGGATNCSLVLSSKAAGNIGFFTNTVADLQVLVSHTASANRYITLTGSNGGNPKIGVSAGQLTLGTGSALATSATEGYVCIPTCAGAPTGVPAGAGAGNLPLIYDTTNNKLYAYNGAWKATAALT